MPKNDNRPKVTLACTECKERNYITTKHRVTQRERIELRKYCSRCRAHQVHRETR
jgi:large subunit ribosomal protein L33